MKIKAFILVMESEASPAFLALLPHGTQIQIVPDSEFEQLMVGLDRLPTDNKEDTPTEPVEAPEIDDLKDPKKFIDDLGDIDTCDGC